MTKYKIIYGFYDSKKEFNSLETLYYIDNSYNYAQHKVKDIKDFLTCYDNNLCICMLKLYKIIGGVFSDSYVEYNENNNEDELLLNKVHYNNQIVIVKKNSQCTCHYYKKLNSNIYYLSKRDVQDSYLKLKNDLNNKIKELQNGKNQLQDELNRRQNHINDLEKKEEWEISDQKKFENFYDIIIDINSILKLKLGWPIEITPQGESKYNEFKNESLVTIGTVGNMNKGKSFILSKLSKIKLPAGVSINTKGLSVKYPELQGHQNRKYILLDSAGFESPILEYQDDESIYKIVKEDKNKEEKEEGEGSDEQQLFREKAKDILITESFLQNFIITTCDILLLIVDNLAYSEQKLINKIKSEIKRTRKDKKLFIIHNLKTYRNESQIKNYINNILLKSGTFSLQKHENISSSNEVIKGEHFTEPLQKGFIGVYHLLFAADGSEAGNIYNKYTINFIEHQFNDIIGKKNFDVINEIKRNFSNNSKFFLNEKVEFKDFMDNEEIMKNKIIKLKEQKELTLKRCFIDEIGIQKFKAGGFEPQYNFFKNGDILEIRVELPGNCSVAVKNPIINNENTIVIINGNKRKDKEPTNPEDNIENTRDFGDFSIEIAFRTADYRIKPEIKNKQLVKGLLLLKYDIDKDFNNGDDDNKIGSENDDI